MSAILITIISFFLEAILSLSIPITTHYWTMLPTFISILYASNHFINHKHYFCFCFIIGILYDIAYTNTFLFHGFLFVLFGYFYRVMEKRLSTWYHFLFLTMLMLFFYRTLSYVMLVIIGYLSLDFSLWIQVTLSSFLGNLFYALLLYLFHYIFYKKKKRY